MVLAPSLSRIRPVRQTRACVVFAARFLVDGGMEGTNLTRSVRAAAWMATHPLEAGFWLRDRMRPRSPLDLALPWTSWTCINFLERHVRAGMHVLEYGGGGSTRFFLRKGCSVTTIESSPLWAEQIVDWARRDGTRDRLELKCLPVTSQADVQGYAAELNTESLCDIVLIDGLEDTRTACLDLVTQKKHAPDWLVVLDDSWRNHYEAHMPRPPEYRSVALRGLGPARIGVTQAHAFFRAGGRFDD